MRDKAEIIWITNEYELGDFGMGGMHLKRGGYVTPSKIFTESLFAERGIDWITRAHVQQGRARPRLVRDARRRRSASRSSTSRCCCRRSPASASRRSTASGADITDRLFLPNGFMRVDADYAAKPYEEWAAGDWPRTYQSPAYPNVFAAGIAFAPPQPISRPAHEPRTAR